MLPDGEMIEEARFIGEKSELPFGCDRIGCEVDASDLDVATRGRNDPSDTAQRGGFARAVWSDEPEDLAGSHRKRQILHCKEVSVAFGQPDHFDHATEGGGRGFGCKLAHGR